MMMLAPLQTIISSTSLKGIVVDDDACSSSQAIIISTSLKVETKKRKLSPTKEEL